MSSRSVWLSTVGTVLSGDDDGVDPNGLAVVVFDRDLRFAIGPEVVEHAVTPRAGQAFDQLVREHDRHRHQLGSLGAGIPEHQALVAGAARVDTLGDVGRLLVNRREHGARLRVETELGAGVSDLLDGVADDLRKIDVAARRDFAGDDCQAGSDQRLAGHAADRILGENRVENGIGNLVGDLVGMPFGHRLRGKQVTTVTAHGPVELLRSDCWRAVDLLTVAYRRLPDAHPLSS